MYEQVNLFLQNKAKQTTAVGNLSANSAIN